MSWSINASGKPSEALASLKTQIANAKCAEPEESIKAKVGDILDLALSAYPETVEVNVSAHGSQWRHEGGEEHGKARNSLSVTIAPKG